MAVGLTEIRAGLATALENKLGSADQQISPYVLRNPTLPTIWARPSTSTPIEYHQTSNPGGVQLWHMLVEAYCGAQGDVAAQQRMDAYLSPGTDCVSAALEADKTLGGIVQDLIVRECRAYLEFVRSDGSAAIGATWTVDVYP